MREIREKKQRGPTDQQASANSEAVKAGTCCWKASLLGCSLSILPSAAERRCSMGKRRKAEVQFCGAAVVAVVAVVETRLFIWYLFGGCCCTRGEQAGNHDCATWLACLIAKQRSHPTAAFAVGAVQVQQRLSHSQKFQTTFCNQYEAFLW
jgi:hypothetical protein